MTSSTTTSGRGRQRLTPVSKPKTAKRRSTSSAVTNEFSNGYYLLLGLVALLCVFGSMMVLSASSVDALRNYGSSWLFFKRQLVWLVVGTGAMWFTIRLDYRAWRQWKT